MKNPVLKKKYDEGYKAGYEQGFEAGKYYGVQASEQTINRLIGKLKEVEGIGPKTFDKIAKGLKLL